MLHTTYHVTCAIGEYAHASALGAVMATPAIAGVLHVFISQQSMLIAFAMTALSISDDEMVKRVEDDWGAGVTGAGNWLLHYFPPLWSWWMTLAWPGHFLGWAACQPRWVLIVTGALWPGLFTVAYGTVYNPHDQYAGDFHAWAILVGGGIGVFIGWVGLVLTARRVAGALQVP